ncbi:hypothetical protein [Xanthobacter autotrophicus]|uniref:hypothetical protein n=1 Tax=Xanthobacter autotrophicus TaxID=280 RepID=UPI0024A61D82|nr:hypothetical protein [Xanthobacter autotrophicus]MDI4656020.1 hypothetical protein [Xanthobacter autotrophicus]
MSIFNDIARAFGPKAAKAPSITALEKLEAEASAAVEAERGRLEGLEAKRPEALLGGDEARLAHRSQLNTARADLEDAEAARTAVRERLEAARLEEAEKARRAAYSKADAAQRTAQTELLAKYPIVIGELLRLRELVADAERLREIANGDLPEGASPLPETESVRDLPGQPRSVVSSEIEELWVGEGGAPVDQAAVRSRDGRTGHVTVQTGFGSHAIPVTRQTFEKRRVRPWQAPIYGERLSDLSIPPLRPEAPPAVSEVEELIPITPPAEAAE